MVLSDVIAVDPALVIGLDDFQSILEMLLERHAAVVHMIEYAKLHSFLPSNLAVSTGSCTPA